MEPSGYKEEEREGNIEKKGKQKGSARFSIIRIYGNSVHVTPDNFCNGLLVESFSSSASRGKRDGEEEREGGKRELGPINYTERIVNAVKWTRRGAIDSKG